MDIFTIKVFEKNIFINPSTGAFSDTLHNVEEIAYIDYNDVINNFKPKFINVCLNISDLCNLSCDYCFNNKKSGKTSVNPI